MTLMCAVIFEELRSLNSDAIVALTYEDTKFAIAKILLHCYLTILKRVWTLVLLLTSLHFHTFAENLTGSLFAFALWFFLYSKSYRRQHVSNN